MTADFSRDPARPESLLARERGKVRFLLWLSFGLLTVAMTAIECCRTAEAARHVMACACWEPSAARLDP